MYYDTPLNLGPSAGAVSVYVFRANSVYDPDFTGTGATVIGYTQAAALYGRYRVLNASMHVSFVNLSTATPLTCFIVANPVTTIGVNIQQILSQRFVWYKSVSASNSAGCVEHEISVPIHRIYGVPAAQVRNEDDFAAITGTNPNNGVYFHVGAYANGASVGNLNVHVRITYDVVWSLPLEMG